jgi:predicted enzyme related to lactoylglutathione lyase
MGQLELRTLLVSVRSIAESLPLYEQALGLPLKFQDGDHYAALDGGAITVGLATDADHPAPGSVALSSKTDDVASAVDALVASGARVEMPATDGGHEVRALLRDAAGTAIVVYGPKVE